MTVAVGDRLSYAGELCTVRFVGEIPAWPGETAYGVEWDNVNKGKHSGSFKGVVYFQTHKDERSGSFVKSSKKHDGTRTFYEAVVDTYGTSTESKEIKIGSKIVESYGFEQLQRLQADFHYLKNISLSRKEIDRVELKELELIQEQLSNLEELDLSFNLFNSLGTVTSIVSQLNITKLKLVGNHFNNVGDFKICYKIKRLDLSLTRPSKEVLEAIPTIFPNVDKLLLSDNEIIEVDQWVLRFKNLHSLDTSMNVLQDIPTGIITQTKIQSLNISDNQIATINTQHICHNVEVLDIRRNNISDSDEIDKLSQVFPNLIEIRINGNPIFIDLTPEEVEMNVIARFKNLKSVNGTEFSNDERTNAELYYISIASNEPRLVDNPRVKELAAKHQVKLQFKSKCYVDNIQNKLISLSLQGSNKTIKMDTLQSNEVLKLKGQISRLFEISYIDIQLSYKILNIEQPINNDLSLISSHNFEQGQTIYINYKNQLEN